MIDLNALRSAIDPVAPRTGSLHCPVHDDANPSLRLWLVDGEPRWKCMAGCPHTDLTREIRSRAEHVLNGHAAAGEKGVGTQRSEFAHRHEDQWLTPSKIWDYTDKDGRIVGKTARYEIPGGKIIRPWIHNGKRWIEKAMPRPRPPYGLLRLLNNPGAPVLVTEGEKACDAAQKLAPQWVCVTWAGGAKVPHLTDWSHLRDRDVMLWPDADEPGTDAMNRMQRRALEAGAASIRRLRVDDLPEAADAADVTWPPEEILARCEPIAVHHDDHVETEAPASEQDRDELDELEKRISHLPLDWHLQAPPPHPFVIHPYIPLRKVSSLIGAGTSSKTLLLCEWAAAITTGIRWRGHSVREGDVVIITWEDERDDYHSKLHSHLQANASLGPYADQIRARLHFIELQGSPYRLVAPDAANGRPSQTVVVPRLIDVLRRRFPDAVQVFFETVSRANSSDESNEGMAMVVAACEEIAHALNVGATAVHHVSKASLRDGAIDAIASRGGSALADNCRATTVLAMINGESSMALWPAGFATTDFAEREIVVVESARSSYGRKAERIHLERVYPSPSAAPYLREVAPRHATEGPKRDLEAERLIEWMQENLPPTGLTERAITDQRSQFELSERATRGALVRLVRDGSVRQTMGKQYGDRGRDVSIFTLSKSRYTV